MRALVIGPNESWSAQIGQHIASRLVEMGLGVFYTVPGDGNRILGLLQGCVKLQVTFTHSRWLQVTSIWGSWMSSSRSPS